jgi:hypothetical protein
MGTKKQTVSTIMEPTEWVKPTMAKACSEVYCRRNGQARRCPNADAHLSFVLPETYSNIPIESSGLEKFSSSNKFISISGY